MCTVKDRFWKAYKNKGVKQETCLRTVEKSVKQAVVGDEKVRKKLESMKKSTEMKTFLGGVKPVSGDCTEAVNNDEERGTFFLCQQNHKMSILRTTVKLFF